MEDVLQVYGLPYDRDYPQVCFDERPCVLHGEVVEALPMKSGKPRRYDYEYERNGTCCLLVAFEPLTGFRMVEVSRQRTAKDYCFDFCSEARLWKTCGFGLLSGIRSRKGVHLSSGVACSGWLTL
jgi:hypothetical protein